VIAALDGLAEHRNRSLTRLVYYTTLIKPIFLDSVLLKRHGLHKERRGITKENLLIRQGLTMVHQLLNYIRVLDQELRREESLCESLNDGFQASIKALKVATSSTERSPAFKLHVSLSRSRILPTIQFICNFQIIF